MILKQWIKGLSLLTVASFWIESSDAPRDARPISWLNWAKLGSAKRGTCPNSSWHVSLKQKDSHGPFIQSNRITMTSYYILLARQEMRSCFSNKLIRLFRYSRFGCVEGVRAVSDILSAVEHAECQSCQEVSWGEISSNRSYGEARAVWNISNNVIHKETYKYINDTLEDLPPLSPLRNRETSSSCGMLSSRKSQYLVSKGRFFRYSRQASVG